MGEERNQQPENSQVNEEMQNTPAAPKASFFEKGLACFIMFWGCMAWICGIGLVFAAVGESQIWLSVPVFASIFILLVYFVIHKICKNIDPSIEKKMSIAAGVSGIVIAIGFLVKFIFVWIDAGGWAALSGPVIILLICGGGTLGIEFGKKVYKVGFKAAEKEFKDQKKEEKDKSSTKDRYCEADKPAVTTSEELKDTSVKGPDTEKKSGVMKKAQMRNI